MHTHLFLYSILAFILSATLAFFQYFYKEKHTVKTYILFALRTLALFLIGLLIINPKITSTVIQNKKPKLSVLVDNSSSINFFKQKTVVDRFISQLKNNKALNAKFNLNFLSFGATVHLLDSLSFSKSHTNIFKAIQGSNNLIKDDLGALVLISDGNQTIGRDYEFINSNKAIFPVVIGDTVQYKDVKIAQLNVNKYSYIKNKFPVETHLFYDGKKPVTTEFSIYNKGKKVFTKKISFTPEKNTQTITTYLQATKEGLQDYTASVKKLVAEKNTKNNTKNFSVEVINQQTKVLLLSSILHPDLGALKRAIESNKQRLVDIKMIDNYKGSLLDYQLVLFYQPTSSFKAVLQERKSNFIIISGTKTDWQFLNSIQKNIKKEAINQSENYQAVYNNQFLTFYQKDIGFNSFPPLQDKFGTLTLQAEANVLLYQKIGNLVTQAPLLITLEPNQDKFAFLFGENLWKWRAASFRQFNSFENFDEFINNLVQYVSSTKKRKRLSVTAKKQYPANSTVSIAAFYTDKNYLFDARASLQITVTNTKTKEQKKLPFSLFDNSYQVTIENLSAGNYTYKVTVKGEKSISYGSFKITDYKVEEQFVNANFIKLQKLANSTKGKLYFPTQQEELINNLIADTSFYTTQKAIPKEKNIIDWQWVLFAIVGLLALEWFIRKYNGKI